ncbi:SOS response-associated peptidase [Falsibacillus pallidus]|uniref:Abasic site processing protein n=1 Tax=Falsibacillus pallidus TaxID=493781 RepID=A0A370GL25_9BACI|nr:SOS response-associated peptidase [Falsibacillus pallidus]RDI43074.1 putative SOS response-associated peptidase YedK [Falsibacillus pallidus]
MCGRYTLNASKEDLIEQFLLDDFPELFEPSYNIAPTQNVLGAVQKKNERKAGYIKWGLVPYWVKDMKKWKPLINARAESIEEKPSYNKLLEKRRMIILADSFYEWSTIDGSKQPYRIQLKEKRPFAFAALWDRNNEDTTCTIITTEANEDMAGIHERMPVILKDDSAIHHWLSDSPFHDVKHLLIPIEDGSLTNYAVSSLVNSTRNVSKECIKKSNKHKKYS